MKEQIPKNLEYSKFDDEIAKTDKIAAEMREQISQMESIIQEYRAKIEKIKTDPSYSEEERIEAVADYRRMINTIQETIRLAIKNISLAHILKDVDQIAKKQADALLRRSEPDELTADIENEDKPPRRVN